MALKTRLPEKTIVLQAIVNIIVLKLLGNQVKFRNTIACTVP
jgi:hypothetical protein